MPGFPTLVTTYLRSHRAANGANFAVREEKHAKPSPAAPIELEINPQHIENRHVNTGTRGQVCGT